MTFMCNSSLSNTILNTPQRTRLMRRVNRNGILGPASRIKPNHKLPIPLGHNVNIPLHKKRITEHPRDLLSPMLNIPHLRINPNLDLGKLRPLPPSSFSGLWLGIRHRRPQVQHTTNGDGVFERTGIQSQKIGSCVCERGSAAEG